MKKQEWNLQALAIAYDRDLQACRNAFERSNVEGLKRKDIIATAARIQKTRKITPGEQAILQQY